MQSLSAFQTHLSEMGDYIGMESCVDLQQEVEEAVVSGGRRRCCGRRERRTREKKEYPPPIPSLSCTENQPARMPWAMRRYYTSDGRLIIREERVAHHEYFKVCRADGRLTLQLVPLDDEAQVSHLSPDEEERDDNNVGLNLNDQDDVDDECEDGKVDSGDEMGEDRTVEKAAAVVTLLVESESTDVVGGSGGRGKCYDYSSVRSNPCMFGIPVPAIRPVHI